MHFSPRTRALLARIVPILLTVATLALFVYFFATHAVVRHALAATNPWILLLIGLLYAVLTLCLVWVYDITLRLCGKRLPFGENLLLTCYSTIANFFGPLQSGPGVRAAYLKRKHRVRLRDYTVASFIYYACYAVVSAVFILVGSHKYWPLTLLLCAAVTAGSLTIVVLAQRRLASRAGGSSLVIEPRLVALLLAATICQLACVTVIYYVELRAVHTGASLLQAIAYGGAANFALFVSLTPGAIGFREAFLAFSKRIHGITTAGILAASVIDRAVYVAFLGVLFLIVLGMHANRRFAPKPAPAD